MRHALNIWKISTIAHGRDCSPEITVPRPRPSASLALLACSCFLAPSAASFAQESVTTASVSGRVLDPSGAVIPHTVVKALDHATGQSRTAETDSQGRFRIPLLPVGSYQFTAHPVGFAESTRELQLSVGAAFDLVLQVSITEDQTAINVGANEMTLEQDRSQISETVLQTEVSHLPFNGRNFLDLALLAPGVSPTNTASVQTFAETAPLVGQGYSVNSQRNFSNSFIVDGLSANDDAAGLAGNSYSMDVVREFQVVTSGGQAEFGRALGGYFNLVTRSGTNDLHGTAYGFLRNQRLNAQNALSRNSLPVTQGQFGASLSGPLRRDRSFLFGNYEARRLNTNGIVTITPANATAINQRLNSLGWTGPRLAVGTGATTLFPTAVHTDTAFLRLDHRFSQGDQFSARYSFYRLNSPNARGAGSLADLSYGTAVRDTNHTVAISNVATLSPRLFNETRGQFTYDSLNAPSNTTSTPAVTISGVATFGRFSSSPTARLNYLYELVDNLLLQHGAHTVKMGADFLYNRDTITFPQSIAGSYTFASLAAFNAGTYNTGGFTQSFGTPFVTQGNPNVGIYLQDEWKIAPALTLNAGLRYDLQFLQTVRTDRNNVSPRFGFAWSPVRTTVVRGSYGLFYDRVPLRALANALLSANNTTDPAQGRLLSYTYSPSTVGAPTFPNTAAAPPAGALLNYALMNRDVQNAYAQQASLGIEQSLSNRATLGISYQQVRGLHLLSSYNTNIALNGTRPDPTRGNVKPYDSRFDSYYDGLAVSLVQRPVSWGSMRVSYTWSKSINNVGEFFFSSPVNNFDFSVDRARSDDDQRHRLVFDATLNSPMTHASSMSARLMHGWRLSGTIQYYSRLPFNIVTGASTLQQTTARPCTVAAFGSLACAEGVKGAVIGRNAGVGFDYFSMNARLSRTFDLGDRWKLETIAESFNALNHRNDAIPNGTFGTGRIDLTPANLTFGQATAVNDPRNVQLAARVSF
jgi:hypothetical protein